MAHRIQPSADLLGASWQLLDAQGWILLLTRPNMGRIVRAGASACERFVGTTLTDKTLTELLVHHEVRSQGRSLYTLRAPDGTHYAFDLTEQAIETDEGFHILLMGTDVTRQVRQQRQNTRLFQAVMVNNPYAIAIFDTEMRYLGASKRWMTDYGIEDQEIIGRTHYDVFPEIDARWKTIHAHCLQGNSDQHPEDPFPRGDGSLDYVRWRIDPWYTETNDIAGIVMFTEVITAQVRNREFVRRQTELETQSMHRRLNTIVANLPIIIYSLDREGRVVTLEGRNLLELNIDPDMWVGCSAFDLHGADEKSAEYLRRGLAGEPQTYTLEAGEHILETFIEPLYTADGEPDGLTAVSFDITEREQARRTLQERTSDLERSNAELERFAFIASHDLQEPLRAVTGHLQILNRRLADILTERDQHHMDFAVDGAKRMKQLIEDLLLYSRVQRQLQPFAPVDLNVVVRHALRNLEADIRTQKASIAIQGLLPTVTGDAGRLTQVFQNLVSNAIKFHGEQRPVVRIDVTEQADAWRVNVHDNGIGVAPDHRDKIFQLFGRLNYREDYPGTGVGLALCRVVAEQHGGTVDFEPAVPQGSIFFITLPKQAAKLTTGAG